MPAITVPQHASPASGRPSQRGVRLAPSLPRTQTCPRPPPGLAPLRVTARLTSSGALTPRPSPLLRVCASGRPRVADHVAVRDHLPRQRAVAPPLRAGQHCQAERRKHRSHARSESSRGSRVPRSPHRSLSFVGPSHTARVVVCAAGRVCASRLRPSVSQPIARALHPCQPLSRPPSTHQLRNRIKRLSLDGAGGGARVARSRWPHAPHTRVSPRVSPSTPQHVCRSCSRAANCSALRTRSRTTSISRQVDGT